MNFFKSFFSHPSHKTGPGLSYRPFFFKGVLILGILGILVPLFGGGSASARPGFISLEWKTDSPPDRVSTVSWAGKNWVMVISPQNKQKPVRFLTLLRPGQKQLEVAENWALPATTRWVEPVQLGNGKEGWLGLIDGAWFLGRVSQKNINWTPLCTCDSLFNEGNRPLPFKARFAVDLDGDGRSEVLLPSWQGLMVYKFSPDTNRLEPLWLNRWGIGESYEIKNGRVKLIFNLPLYTLKDVNNDQILDFIVSGAQGVSLVEHPRPILPDKKAYYFPQTNKIESLARRNIPPLLLGALRRLPKNNYSSAKLFQNALKKIKSPPKNLMTLWAKHQKTILNFLKEPAPTYEPRYTGLKSLGITKNKEKHRVMEVMDMNGDKTPDLVHIKSYEGDSILDHKHQLRWYEGTRTGKNLQFADKPQLFFSEGPAFVELLFPRTAQADRPFLFLATAQVSLMAVVRAFTLNKAVLDVFLYQWEKGKLVLPPRVSGSISIKIKGKNKKNRPLIILADLNGDGFREFLFNQEVDALTAYKGTKTGFDPSSTPLLEQEVPLPIKPDSVFVKDLNGDNKEEILFWYKRSPPALQKTIRVIQYTTQRPESKEIPANLNE